MKNEEAKPIETPVIPETTETPPVDPGDGLPHPPTVPIKPPQP